MQVGIQSYNQQVCVAYIEFSMDSKMHFNCDTMNNFVLLTYPSVIILFMY
ncbi:hypothetical protein Lalb_Chr24g0393131 [Lupinus albus]|uniref:Uncharacterized protein n=1 Tax=Lupinus albus TaxID=3870 RepID=A0A6A4NA04_LUPAL|nr:hypothetical protein Lalb_Chr24g0393131 [Lupinus albus]